MKLETNKLEKKQWLHWLNYLSGGGRTGGAGGYTVLVYTRSWTITNPEFLLASQPWTIRNSPWLAK